MSAVKIPYIQELIIKCALQEGDTSVYWKEIKKDFFHYSNNYEVHRLLPYLYISSINSGKLKNDPLFPILKGAYIKNWTENLLKKKELEEIVKKLSAHNVKCVALKGMAMATFYYKDFGSRRMRDLDLLLPFEKREEACELLNSMGFESIDPHETYPFSQGRAFQKEGHTELDMHFCLLYEWPSPKADNDVWEKAVPAQIGDIKCYRLNPSHQLFHTCINGYRNIEKQTYWIIDAFEILKGGEVDWNIFVNEATKRKLIVRTLIALQTIEKTTNIKIPIDVMNELSFKKLSFIEKCDKTWIEQGEKGRFGGLPARISDFARTIQVANKKPNIKNFILYLVAAWKLDSGIIPFIKKLLHKIIEITWKRR